MTAEYTNGTLLIGEERLYQIHDAGWTSEHDDTHVKDELARAASYYATPRRFRGNAASTNLYWPFELRHFKPARDNTINERILELVKAGALIAAEIERLQRINEGGETIS